MCNRQWWAQCKLYNTGPCETRQQAADELLIILASKGGRYSKTMWVMTGYGAFGPSFDIQWIDRDGRSH